MRAVEKEWGSELWWAETDKYIGKIIYVMAGHRLSYQYHNEKTETMLFIEGSGTIILDDEEIMYAEGTIFHVEPKAKHRVIAETDTTIVEVSTTEIDDIVRLEDDYGRETTK